MKLFVWGSNALKNYGPGHIIVQAEFVDEARAKALDQYKLYLKERYYYYYGDDGDFLDADDRAYIEENIDQFQKDTAVDPQVIEAAAFFVEGSE